MPIPLLDHIVEVAVLRNVARKQSALSGEIHEIVCVLPNVVNKELQDGRIRNRFVPLTALLDSRDKRI
ncbi:hypothetical protein Dpoa2040_003084 [Dickeya sp. CFBP 2040]|uniref:hypothetical protein n=1 Tax=Dickeya sp. CFBP 2040 TaxID=2718531 RepID=UPI001444AE70|nr:hypothetical protein [Dickeya sp. CFBP 2040]NKI75770.1 hypothetical protein [Dickeya sp. CFBP 2040]